MPCWRFANSPSQTLSGVVEVEDGTLEFDSIRPAGFVSSLGMSIDRYEDKCAVTGSLKKVDYAYLLGGTNGETAVFSYIGSEPRVVHDRPIALQGSAVLKAPNAPALKWKSVSAESTGETRLTVDCVQGQTNYLADISDGKGRVSIAKSGAGDLVLSGALNFTGDLVASGGGTLTVFNPKGELYSWYRLVLKETTSTSPLEEYSAYASQARVALNEWGLYAESGARQNQYGASTLGEYEATLPPRKIICADNDMLAEYPLKTGIYAHAARLLDNDNSGGYRFDVCWNGDKTPIMADDPSTWINVVLHMDNYSDEITYYDLNYAFGPGYGSHMRSPVSWSVEGSGDGLVWEDLASVNGSLAPSTLTNYYCWVSDGTSSLGYSNKPENAPHAKLPLSSSRVRADYTQLASLRSVTVEQGTTLKKVGYGTITIGRIAADSSGVGTIDGFSFASGGVLSIQDISPGATVVEIPADFRNADGLSCITGWSVAIDGAVARRFRVASVSPTSIKICRRGFVASFK